MDRLAAMETFVRVVDAGSFSAAARDLGVGQPAVSKLVAGLEDRLQVRLLVRSTRRLTPTDAGLVYYEHARRAVDEANEAEIMARGSATALEGRLRVCAPVTFARLHMAPHLRSFLAAHPRLRLEVVMDDRTIDLVEENIDVAFRIGAMADSALTARKLAQSDALLVATPEYLERRGTPRTPGDLLSHDAIVFSQVASGAVWRFRRGTAETSVAVEAQVSFTAAEGLRAGVLAGLGVATGSRWMFAPELLDGRLTPLLEDWSLPPVELFAVFPAGRMPSARTRRFVDWFEAVLQRTTAR